MLYRSLGNPLFQSQIVPSGPPEAVLLTVTSATEILVSWSEVPPIHQNGIITLYEVFYYPLEDYHNPLPMVQTTTELSFNLMGLHEFADYSIQVRAFTEVGPGPYSDQRFIRTDTAGTQNTTTEYYIMMNSILNCTSTNLSVIHIRFIVQTWNTLKQNCSSCNFSRL